MICDKIYSKKHKGQNLEISEKINKKSNVAKSCDSFNYSIYGTRYFLIIIFDFTLNVKEIYKFIVTWT